MRLYKNNQEVQAFALIYKLHKRKCQRSKENYHCINKLRIYFKYILYFLHSQKVLGLNQDWGLSLWHFLVSPCLYVWCSLIMSETEGGVPTFSQSSQVNC